MHTGGNFYLLWCFSLLDIFNLILLDIFNRNETDFDNGSGYIPVDLIFLNFVGQQSKVNSLFFEKDPLEWNWDKVRHE